MVLSIINRFVAHQGRKMCRSIIEFNETNFTFTCIVVCGLIYSECFGHLKVSLANTSQ